MVWLVQNCRSNRCLQFLKPQSFRGGGLSPPGSPTRALPLTRWGLYKQSPYPSPTHAPPPLTTNPGSAPDNIYYNTQST